MSASFALCLRQKYAHEPIIRRAEPSEVPNVNAGLEALAAEMSSGDYADGALLFLNTEDGEGVEMVARMRFNWAPGWLHRSDDTVPGAIQREALDAMRVEGILAHARATEEPQAKTEAEEEAEGWRVG
jgi:hypothetical protein